MAVNHIAFNDQTHHGRTLRRGMNQLEEAMDQLNDTRATIIQMRDGDGSQAAHYTYATAKFGADSDAKMRELFLELDSCLSKLNSDAQVSSVNAAILQLLAKLR